MAFGKPGSGDIMREEVEKARRAARKRSRPKSKKKATPKKKAKKRRY